MVSWQTYTHSQMLPLIYLMLKY